MQKPNRHEPVLVQEVLSHFPANPKIVIDGTIGDGGHAEAILNRFPSIQQYFGFDRDPASIERAKSFCSTFADKMTFFNEPFTRIKEVLPEETKADAVLLDLGFSSAQIDAPERGFSFLHDGPLDMRFDQQQELTASDIVNSWDEASIGKILREYGDEPNARALAKEIVRGRKQSPFQRTKELSDAVTAWYRERLGSKREIPWIGGMHPATRTFQALRIAVNDELNAIKQTLPLCVQCLATRGRLLVISFHSKEDSIVKHFIKDESRHCICPPELPACVCHHSASLHPVTKKAVTASEKELQNNTKSRSAKLRVAEKI